MSVVTGQRTTVLLLLSGAAVLVLLLWAAPAGAHAVLLESAPEDGESTEGGPEEIALMFNEPMQQPASITVTGPDGETVIDDSAQIDNERVFVELEPLPEDGTYTVEWRAVSADDHPIDGEFTFEAVDVAVAEEAEEEQEAEEPAVEPTPEDATESETDAEADEVEEPPDEPGEAIDDEAVAATEDEGASILPLLLGAAVVVALVATVGALVARRRGTAGD